MQLKKSTQSQYYDITFLIVEARQLRETGPTLKTSPSTKRLLESWSTNLISSNAIFFTFCLGLVLNLVFVEEKVQLQGNRQVIMMKFTTSFLSCH